MKKVSSIIALVLVLAASAMAQAPTFQDFLAQFPKATLPYSFQAEELQSNLSNGINVNENRLDWDFYAFLPELETSAAYSNTVVYPEPVAMFETENHYAVLYNVARGRSMGNTSYAVTVFGKDGQYIATNYVAGANAQNITSATINENLNALISESKINWTLDVKENGIKGNSISSLEAPAQTILSLLIPGNPDQVEWNVQPGGAPQYGAATSK
jgi:hypothetical protein